MKRDVSVKAKKAQFMVEKAMDDITRATRKVLMDYVSRIYVTSFAKEYQNDYKLSTSDKHSPLCDCANTASIVKYSQFNFFEVSYGIFVCPSEF